ncbi:carbohydrate binding domain-containing protein [Bacteroidales bacterium OttesenSCG-928-M11]|nr:carbohydrate binding domain-containing protein [Bacteroidales bacterium OttesenSCG-928-M11]
MLFDKTNGAGVVSFQYGSYGEENGGQLQLYTSTDGGINWQAQENPITVLSWNANGKKLSTASYTLNITGNIRIKIVKINTKTNTTVNIDDIKITDYIEIIEPTIPKIDINKSEIHFNPTSIDKNTKQEITIAGENLTNSITYTLNENDHSTFSITESAWDSNLGGTLTINFVSSVVGAFDATLVISSTGVENISIPLHAEAISPNTIATLSEIYIDNELIAGFDPYVFQYTYMLPEGHENLPNVSATTTDAEATISTFDQPEELPTTINILVTAADGLTQKNYTLYITGYIAPSSNANLSDITINNVSLPNFNKNTTEYSLVQTEDFDGIPTIDAIAEDIAANVSIDPVDKIPSNIKITVTAEDLSQQVYILYLRLPYEEPENNLISGGGFEIWRTNGPRNWDGSLSSITSSQSFDSHLGKRAANLINTENEALILATENTVITEGRGYEISFYAKGKGEIRTGLYTAKEGDETNYNEYIEINSDNWIQYAQIIQANNSTNAAQFLLSAKNTNNLLIDDVFISGFTVIEPTIISDKESIDFEEQYITEESNKYTITISSKDLSDEIHYSIKNNDPTIFKIEEGEDWNSTSGGSLNLTFTPAATINYSATLEFTSEAASKVSIPLIGKGAERSNISSLAGISINEIALENFTPETISYWYMLPQNTEFPLTIVATPSDKNADIQISDFETIPTTVSITVTSPNGASETIYSVRIVNYFAEPEENIIQNGGFELWDNTIPVGWGGYETSNSNVYAKSENSHFGFYSTELIRTIENPYRFSTKGISLEKDHSYSFSYYAKGKGDINTGLYFGESRIEDENNIVSINSNEWTLYTHTFEPEISGTEDDAEFYFSFSNTNGLFVDDVVITAIRHLIPEVIVDKESVNFGSIYITDKDTIELTITGIDLSENINCEIEENTDGLFEIKKDEGWDNLKGGKLFIIFAPESIEEVNASIIISQGQIEEPIIIAVKGAGQIKSSNALLNSLTINDEEISGFDSFTFEYDYLVPVSDTKIPVVDASPEDSMAKVSITQADSYTGEAVVLVTAHDGTEQTYTIQFARATDAKLSDLQIDGVSISGFDSNIIEYRYMLPEGYDGTPIVTAIPNDLIYGAQVNAFEQPTSFPATIEITVTAADGETKMTYSLLIREYGPLSSDATLAEIKIDDVLIDGFNPEITEYSHMFSQDYSKNPEVTAKTNEEYAVINIDQTGNLPDNVKISVIADDSSEKIYNVYLRPYYVESDENYIINGGFENWRNSNEVNEWSRTLSNLTIAQAKNSHQGLLAVELINTSSTYQDLSTGTLSVISDYGYKISFFARGSGEIRTGLYDAREGEGYIYSPTITVNSNEWTAISQTIKATNTTDIARFLFSASNTNGLFIDDVFIEWFVEPVINTDKESIDFGNEYISEDSEEQTITISSKYLSENITYRITGADSGSFLVTESANWQAATGGNLSLKFKPTQTGSHSANLELSSEGASTKSIALSGNGIVRSDIATLSEILINGNNLPNFNPEVTNYLYMLPKGTTAPIIIEPTATDQDAVITFTNPSVLPATVSISVTSPNGAVTKEYFVRIVEYFEEPESLISNGGFEIWNNGKPDGWGGSETTSGGYTKSDNSLGGFYATELIRGTGMQYRFSTQPVSLLQNYRYILSFYVKGVGTLKTGVSINGERNDMENRTINSQEWVQYTDTFTPGVTITNAAEFYFAFNETNGLFIDNVVITPSRILEPEISSTTTSLDFGMVYVTDNKDLEVTVSAVDLTEAIEPIITGTGKEAFSINTKDDWNSLTGGTLSVVFSPLAEVNYNVNLEIRQSECETIIIPISGNGKTKSSNANLSDLTVGGITIPGFSPTTYNYTYIIPNSSNVIPIVGATVSSSQATINITQAENIGDFATVAVIAHDGTEATYKIQFIRSDDATLSDIKIDGSSIKDFNSEINHYLFMLKEGYSGIPTVSITINDVKNGATATISSIESLPTIVNIEVTAANGMKNTYTVRIIPYYKEPEGNFVSNGGFESWTGSLPNTWSGTQTNLTYSQSQDSHLGFYSVNLNNATGSEKHFSTQAYSVTFDYGYIVSFYAKGKGKIRTELYNGSSISSSNDFINVDSETWQLYQQTVFPDITTNLAEFVLSIKESAGLLIDDVVITEYRILHPEISVTPSSLNFGEIYKWDTTSPAQTITVSTIDLTNPITYPISGANEGVFTISEIDWNPMTGGTLSITFTPDEVKEYSATLEITSIDITGNSKTVNLSGVGLTRKSDATLTDLKLNGQTIEGFDPEILEYNVLVYKSSENIPTITASLNDTDAKIEINPASAIPGTTEVVVTAHDRETIKTYKVNFYRSDDATLTDIKINGTSLSNFDTTITYYRYMLSESATTMPSIEATAKIANAKIEINQPTSLPAIVEIKVTAEDDVTEKVYTVRVVDYFEEPFGSYIDNGGFEVWENDAPYYWEGKKSDFTKTDAILSEDSHWGYYALELINQTPYTKRISTLSRQVLVGMDFEVTFYVKGKGDIRTGVFDERSIDEGFFHNDYITIDSDTWTKYSQIIHITKTSSNAEFILSAKNTNGLIVDDVVIRLVSEDGSPSITTNNDSYSFEEKYVGDSSVGKILFVAGSGLTENIEYELTGENNEGFTIQPQTDWNPEIGGNLLIMFEPKVAGLHDVTLALKSSGETLKSITLAGLGKARHTDPSLKELKIDNVPIANFSPTQIEYSYIVPLSHSGIPTVSTVKNDELATEVIEQATTIPGAATIRVTAHDKVNTRTYTVNFIRSSEASLSSIKVDGVEISGFEPDTYTYFHMLPMGYVGLPEISAVANDAINGASVNFNQPTKIPEKVIIEVNSADGENQATYTLNIIEYDDNAEKNLIKNGSFEFWSEVAGDATLPDGWFGSKSTVGIAGANMSNDAHSGNYSCELVNTLSGYKRFTTQAISVERGIYQVTFYVKGKGDIRVEAFDGRSSNNGFSDENTYISIDSDSWTMYSQQVQINNKSDLAEFAFYIRNTSGLFIDDVLIEWAAPHGINNITDLAVYTTISNGILSVHDAPLGARISLYATNGNHLATKEATSSLIEFNLPQKGVVIVHVVSKKGSKTMKVVNK